MAECALKHFLRMLHVLKGFWVLEIVFRGEDFESMFLFKVINVVLQQREPQAGLLSAAQRLNVSTYSGTLERTQAERIFLRCEGFMYD